MRISPRAQQRFILQQGFPEPDASACPLQYSALVFQPRVVGLILVAAVALQAPLVFFLLAAVLWFSAAIPSLNPFDVLYKRIFARSNAAPVVAPGPRRFAQFLAGAFAIAIGVSILLGWRVTAYVLEGMFLAAVGALAFGAFCFGSFLFHLIRGRARFALRTLPWTRGT